MGWNWGTGYLDDLTKGVTGKSIKGWLGGGEDVMSAPVFQPDPNVAIGQDDLRGQYQYLYKGLTSPEGNLTGLLGDTVNVSPLVSKYSQQLAQSQLDPAFRQKQQDLINTLEANNQLTGSTTASALGNLSADYMASLTGMQAQYGLADVERALNTRVNLYNMGLGANQNFIGNALQNQSQMNNFGLSNFENQVAASLMGQTQTGGMAGALQGAIGGAMAGSAFGPYGMAIGAGLGGYAGYSGSPSAGGSYLSAGSSLLGSKYSSPSTINYGRESIYNPATSYTAGSNYYSPLTSSSVGL